MEILTGGLPTPEQLRERITNWHEPNIRMAALYQKLIAGRASETVGIYKPNNVDAHLVTILDTECVLFVVKTAKTAKPSQGRGARLRGAALPVKADNDAEELYEYFQDHPGLWDFSYRTYLRRCKEMFQGFTYHVDYYEKIVYKLQNGIKVPVKDLNKAGDWVNRIEPVPMHTRNAATHVIRHVEIMDLGIRKRFDPIDLQLYAGHKGRAFDALAPASERYLHIAPTAMSVEILTLLAERYLPKLLEASK